MLIEFFSSASIYKQIYNLIFLSILIFDDFIGFKLPVHSHFFTIHSSIWKVHSFLKKHKFTTMTFDKKLNKKP